MLKLSLQDSRVYLSEDYSNKPSEEHPVSKLSPLLTCNTPLFTVTHFRLPHLSGRIRTEMTLEINAVVPQTAASARIVLESTPRDLYRFAFHC